MKRNPIYQRWRSLREKSSSPPGPSASELYSGISKIILNTDPMVIFDEAKSIKILNQASWIAASTNTSRKVLIPSTLTQTSWLSLSGSSRRGSRRKSTPTKGMPTTQLTITATLNSCWTGSSVIRSQGQETQFQSVFIYICYQNTLYPLYNRWHS